MEIYCDLKKLSFDSYHHIPTFGRREISLGIVPPTLESSAVDNIVTK